MGRDNKKKINKGQEKVNLKDIPLNWTEEEIINAYKNNSSSLEIKMQMSSIKNYMVRLPI